MTLPPIQKFGILKR